MYQTLSLLKNAVLEDFDFKSYGLIFLFLAALIFFNYRIDFEDSILDSYHNQWIGWLYYCLFYIATYGLAMLLMIKNKSVKHAVYEPRFWLLVISGLAMICLNKNFDLISVDMSSMLRYEKYYTHKVLSQANSLGIYIAGFILLGVGLDKAAHKGHGLWNFKSNFELYFIFLLLLVPFIYWASTTQSFLQSYPRLQMKWFPEGQYFSHLLKYEPLYLLNFIGVEWLFRGFMVLAIMKYCDKRAVILIATIYCIFHFGKPLGECISSFFGGYILGMITYCTRTIWGGVVVHMGIAFLMDAFALWQYLSL